MIMTEAGVFPIMEKQETVDSSRISILKQKINDEDYLCEAIQRIAQVLSNEITGTCRGGAVERKRR